MLQLIIFINIIFKPINIKAAAKDNIFATDLFWLKYKPYFYSHMLEILSSHLNVDDAVINRLPTFHQRRHTSPWPRLLRHLTCLRID